MSNPSSNSTEAGKCRGRSLTVLELTVLLEELDRVVCELEDSMTELALPFDEPSRVAASTAIAMARGG
jgi:hypothetical protein